MEKAGTEDLIARLEEMPAFLEATLGRLSAGVLCDLPAMIAAHDASHRAEIEAWLAERR